MKNMVTLFVVIITMAVSFSLGSQSVSVTGFWELTIKFVDTDRSIVVNEAFKNGRQEERPNNTLP